MHGAGMTVVMSQPAIGHAAAGGKAPLEVTGKDSPPPAEEVPVMGATEPVDEVVADENDSGEGDDDNEGEEGGEGEGNDDDDTEEEEEAEEGKKWLKHYSSMQSILLVGDADFSFSLVLATAFRSGANLVATSLNTYACKGTAFAATQ
jgi:25S rRNA (uracil2634-N3)-methyltransferase